jgi:hypothetical protein
MARARARNGQFTAERITETTRTERVTERVTFDDDTLEALPLTEPIERAQGWDPGPIRLRHDYLAQRTGQWQQCLALLVTWNASTRPREGWDTAGGYSSPDGGWDPGGGYRDPGPEWLIQQAKTILRAGPGATPLELTMGRSI